MRAIVLLGITGLGLLLPHGILIIPLWISYWVLRPFSPRPAVSTDLETLEVTSNVSP